MMKIIIYLLLFSIAFSCRNEQKAQPERILHDFDSLNRLMSESGNLYPYDSLVRWAYEKEEGALRQLYYATNDFYGFLHHTRWSFYLYSGDTSGMALPPEKENDVRLVKSFIADKKGPASKIYSQLQGVTHYLSLYASTDSLKKGIALFESRMTGPFTNSDDFMRVWFKDIPAVAFITFLNSFEQTVKNLETKVLQEYLKK